MAYPNGFFFKKATRWTMLGLSLLLIALGAYYLLGVEQRTYKVLTDTEEEAHILAAEGYQKYYQSELAIAEFTKAIKNNPNNAVSRSGRAKSLARIGKYKLALKDITRAIELDSNLIENYLIQGEILHGLNDFRESIASLSHYIKFNPTDPKGFFERAYSYHRGSYPAVNNYNRLVALVNTGLQAEIP